MNKDNKDKGKNKRVDLFLTLVLVERDRLGVPKRITCHVSYKQVIRSHFLRLQVVERRHVDDKLLPIPVRLYDSAFSRRDRDRHDLVSQQY